MDGRGRWLDNVYVERLWRSVKRRCHTFVVWHRRFTIAFRGAALTAIDLPVMDSGFYEGWA